MNVLVFIKELILTVLINVLTKKFYMNVAFYLKFLKHYLKGLCACGSGFQNSSIKLFDEGLIE
jgi:hypothetical protein